MPDLTYPGGKMRLYVEAPLHAGARVEPTPAQSHYLLNVMRAKAGDRVSLFNGRDGEWAALLSAAGKRACALVCDREIAPQSDVPDLWFVFAPVKKTPADYVAQKATELGVRVLQPVLTRRTVVRRVNEERLRANAIEAAEQSGRLTVPEVRSTVALEKLLAGWPAERKLVFCDEAGEAPSIIQALDKFHPPLAGRGRLRMRDNAFVGRGRAPRSGAGEGDAWAILTGPEGGFDPAERALVRAQRFAIPVSLGGRILRADTAGLAALAVWQAMKGDWH